MFRFPKVYKESLLMTTGTREEIRVLQLAIRFLLEGHASGGSAVVFEFDVPAAATVPVRPKDGS